MNKKTNNGSSRADEIIDRAIERQQKFRRWEKNCEKYRFKCQWWSGILIGFCIGTWCGFWTNTIVTLIVYFVLFVCAFWRVCQYGRGGHPFLTCPNNPLVTPSATKGGNNE